jgi:hypothetical protein
MAVSSILDLEMADGSAVHQGDKRRVKATVTDDSDVAATPTQLKIAFTPPSGATVTYAKTPSGDEQTLTMLTDNVGYADHTYNEGGWWSVVAAGSGNMAEVEPMRIYVVPVTGAPT